MAARGSLDPRGSGRPLCGCRKELEEGKSYDKLWNAAQLELVHTGKMHGFMRMCDLRSDPTEPSIVFIRMLASAWPAQPAHGGNCVLSRSMHVLGGCHQQLCTCTATGRGRHSHRVECSSDAMYCRYWAKKILEWTNSPEEALRISIYLNDKYELDGRDPNGARIRIWHLHLAAPSQCCSAVAARQGRCRSRLCMRRCASAVPRGV